MKLDLQISENQFDIVAIQRFIKLYSAAKSIEELLILWKELKFADQIYIYKTVENQPKQKSQIEHLIILNWMQGEGRIVIHEHKDR